MAVASVIRTEREARSLSGESPRWHRLDRRLYWVDTRAPALHAFDPSNRSDMVWELPSHVGCAVLTNEGALVALRTGLFEFRFDGATLRQIALAPYDPRYFTFGDGGCDPVGRFVVGEMYLPLAPSTLAGGEPDERRLSCLNPNGSWRDLDAPAKTSNGLAWSPDGRTLYQSDTTSKTIFAFDYDVELGRVANRRVFARVDTRHARHGPDGAAVDSQGFYLCAVFGEACLLRFDPDGTLERRIDMPVQYPTMPAYGGLDMSTVFVTSANWMIEEEDRSARPLEGGLFSFEAPVPGLPGTIFDSTM